MSGSFKKIDYRLRPAKHIERLMMCDAFRRLRFGSIEDYRYVGMGSVYFSDFSLFHRELGINKMTSIESVDSAPVQARFNDNKPYSSIELKFGKCSSVLPEIDLSQKSLLWLDYDGRLDLSVLNDLAGVAAKISSGSVLAFSVQCLPNDGRDDSNYDYAGKDGDLLAYARHVFAAERIAPKWTTNDLAGWGTARLFRELATNEISSAVSDRNGELEDEFVFEQIFNFHYSDGASMLTVGWVFFLESDRDKFEQSAFNQLSFFRNGEEPFGIKIPLLTLREMRALERQLPNVGAGPVLGSIPSGDAHKYISLYRYFPNFTPAPL